MSKLIDVVSKIDFDLLHQQTETLTELISRLTIDLESAEDSNADLQDEVDYLQKTIDDLVGLVEFNDSLMIAAADDGEWEDPTRPVDLDLE